MLISVVICTYNRAQFLRLALGSMESQTASSDVFEVVVVNNNSSDNTDGVARSFCDRLSHFRLVFEHTQGLSHARNRGYQEAAGAYVAYLDDDAKAAPNWLEEMLSFIRRNPEVKAFGGPYFGFSSKPIPDWIRPGFGSREFGDVERRIDDDNVPSGSNMVFAKETLEQFGGFDPSFGMDGNRTDYGEETELFLRLQRNGVAVYCVPTMYIFHFVRPEKLSLRWQLTDRYLRARAQIRLWGFGISLRERLPQLWRDLKSCPRNYARTRGVFWKRRLFDCLSDVMWDFAWIAEGVAQKRRNRNKDGVL
jgi:glycosyltransferase involved in cell wall biosynthesis